MCSEKGRGLCILSEVGSEKLLHKLMNKHHRTEQALHHADATTKQSNTRPASGYCARVKFHALINM